MALEECVRVCMFTHIKNRTDYKMPLYQNICHCLFCEFEWSFCSSGNDSCIPTRIWYSEMRAVHISMENTILMWL